MRTVAGRCLLRAAVSAALLACRLAGAQEPKKEAPGITAIEPASLVAGSKSTLKVRGFKLKEASEVRFPKAPGVKAEIKEKKDAAQPNGLENKLVGESQVLIELTLPAELAAGPLEYVMVTPSGETTGRVPVVASAAVMEEKES